MTGRAFLHVLHSHIQSLFVTVYRSVFRAVIHKRAADILQARHKQQIADKQHYSYAALYESRHKRRKSHCLFYQRREKGRQKNEQSHREQNADECGEKHCAAARCFLFLSADFCRRKQRFHTADEAYDKRHDAAQNRHVSVPAALFRQPARLQSDTAVRRSDSHSLRRFAAHQHAFHKRLSAYQSLFDGLFLFVFFLFQFVPLSVI